MAEKYGVDVKVCDRPEDIYQGAHIVAALTDSQVPVLNSPLIEKDAHIVYIGSGTLDAKTMKRVDVYLRFEVRKRRVKRARGVMLTDRHVTLADIMSGRSPGRAPDDQITWSERGNLQGAQFYAAAGKAYERVKAAGLGHEIATRLFLQDIRD